MNKLVFFKDRVEAGELLAEKLKDYKNSKNTLVLGIPRGGVVVAAVVAKVLNLPLDIVITRKIVAPEQKELAVGALDPSGDVFLDWQLLKSLGLSAKDLRSEIRNQIDEIKRREKLYRKGKDELTVKGKNIILVDDGVATGSTVISASRYLKKSGAKTLILAVPVISKGTAKEINQNIDQIIALTQPETLGSVGNFYQNFGQVEDEEVLKYLR